MAAGGGVGTDDDKVVVGLSSLLKSTVIGREELADPPLPRRPIPNPTNSASLSTANRVKPAITRTGSTHVKNTANEIDGSYEMDWASLVVLTLRLPVFRPSNDDDDDAIDCDLRSILGCDLAGAPLPAPLLSSAIMLRSLSL